MATLLDTKYTYYVVSGSNTPAGTDNRYFFRIYLDSQSVSENKSYLHIDGYVQIVGDLGALPTIQLSNRINDTWTSTKSTSVSTTGTYYVGTWNFEINHNNEGVGSFSYLGRGYINGVYTYTATSTYTLPTIPRVSSVTNNTSSGNRRDFGTSVTFTINRASSSFTHRLTYVVGGTTYTISTNATTSVTYTFPTSLINNFTTTTTPNIIVKCETYNGSTKIGEANTTVYLHVPSSYVPTVSLAISDTNPITSGWGLWVKSRSVLQGVITSSGVAGSTITNRSTTVEGQTLTGASFSKTITTAGNVQIKSTVTDSRGRQASDTKNITVLDYNLPTIVNAKVVRVDANGNEDDFGTYGKVVCQYNITSLNNKNAKTLKVSLGSNTKTFTLSSYSGTITANNNQLFEGLATDTTYNFTFTLSDSFGPITQTVSVPPSYVLVSYRAGGKGISFGRVATEDGFNVYMPAKFHNVLEIYPIGSIYMSVNNVNPSTFFGGTWVRFGNGRALVGVNENDTDFNTVEKTGGVKTHNHTSAAHTHGAGNLHAQFMAYSTTSLIWRRVTGVPSWSDNRYKSATGSVGSDPGTNTEGVVVNGTTSSTTPGNTGTSSTLQPYITVYMWKRVA